MALPFFIFCLEILHQIIYLVKMIQNNNLSEMQILALYKKGSLQVIANIPLMPQIVYHKTCYHSCLSVAI